MAQFETAYVHACSGGAEENKEIRRVRVPAKIRIRLSGM
jgi:hypothetical protein